MLEPPRLTSTAIGALARRVLDSHWPRYELATAVLAAPRQLQLGPTPSEDSAGTSVPEFVATLSDDERTMLRDLIDAEADRREAEPAHSGGPPARHDDRIVAYQPDRAIPEVSGW